MPITIFVSLFQNLEKHTLLVGWVYVGPPFSKVGLGGHASPPPPPFSYVRS